jgi:ATP-dependent DNA helicase RecQ
VLAITQEGREVMHDRTQARLGSWQPPAPRRARKDSADHRPAESAAAPQTEGGRLREALREWRAAKSKRLGVPPYTIFWDRTLDELCEQRPETPGELLGIWGIGEAKQRMFGAELLALIASTSE